MMWDQTMGWDWLGTLAIVPFWALIIVLALAPIKYLRSELRSPELSATPQGNGAADGAAANAGASEKRN